MPDDEPIYDYMPLQFSDIKPGQTVGVVDHPGYQAGISSKEGWFRPGEAALVLKVEPSPPTEQGEVVTGRVTVRKTTGCPPNEVGLVLVLQAWHRLYVDLTEPFVDLDLLARISRRVKHLTRDWALETLAAKANIPERDLYEIEQGKQMPSADQIVRLADMLDVTVDYLLGRVGNDPEPELKTSLVPTKGSPERETHMLRLARHVHENLFSWTMAADGGVQYGFSRDGKWEKTYISREDILKVIDWQPRPDFDEGEEWPEEVYEYAWELLVDLGEFMRTRCRIVVDDRAGSSNTPVPA